MVKGSGHCIGDVMGKEKEALNVGTFRETLESGRGKKTFSVYSEYETPEAVREGIDEPFTEEKLLPERVFRDPGYKTRGFKNKKRFIEKDNGIKNVNPGIGFAITTAPTPPSSPVLPLLKPTPARRPTLKSINSGLSEKSATRAERGMRCAIEHCTHFYCEGDGEVEGKA